MKLPATAAASANAQPLDNIQLLLQRKAELTKNKAKFTLTETDAQLLTTHSSEIHFEDGQLIMQELQNVDNVFRIKSGKVSVSKNGLKLNTVGKGWLIADQNLMYTRPGFIIKITLHAVGPVVIQQLNLPFVKQLFEVDNILQARVMRHLVSKYSLMFEHVINNIDSPHLRDSSVPSSPSLSLSSSSSASSSSVSSSSASSSASSSRSISPSTSISDLSPDAAKLLTAEIAHTSDLSQSSDFDSVPSSPSSSSITFKSSPSVSSISSSSSVESSTPVPTSCMTDSNRPNPSKRDSNRFRKQAYKSYPLVNRGGGVQTMQLKSDKLTVVAKSFGFSFKTTIEFSKILNLTKIGENAATIVYQPRKVANVFFKHYNDREEFFGIVNSLTTHSSLSPEGTRRNSGKVLSAPPNPDVEPYEEVLLCGGKSKGSCAGLQTALAFKKGETIIEEGDLFQRVYTLTKGFAEVTIKGKRVCTMEEGDIFGMGSLLHLRPVQVTIKAGTDNTELLMVPAFKLNALIETDSARAAQIYRNAAIALDHKISQASGYLPNYKRMIREKREQELSEETNTESESADVETDELDNELNNELNDGIQIRADDSIVA